MAVLRISKGILYLFLCFGLSCIQTMKACNDSYQCRFGQQCCKETNTCKASCKGKSHETNIGVIVGIIVAVALGNVLFWVSFCCLCWCRSNKRFRYRSFNGNQDVITLNIEDNNETNIDDYADDDDDTTTKVFDIENESLTEEIGLPIVTIEQIAVQPKPESQELGECSNGEYTSV